MNSKQKAVVAVSVLAAGLAAILIFKKRYMILDKAKLLINGRTIKKIIIHCSATKPTQACTVELIDQWHRARGFKCIGYHYVIYADGTVHEGRPLAEVGAHTEGYNSESVGICYVGGLDATGKAADTRTDAQKKALRQLVSELLATYPEATVHGHREFANKACPCFDVQAEKWR